MILITLALVAIANLSVLTTAFPDANCVGSIKTLKTVLALDCSGSVSDESWAITIDFAKDFVTNLITENPTTEVAIEFFSDRDEIKLPFTDDLQSILTALDKPRCNGGTNFPVQLQSMFDGLAGDATKILLLVTDGYVNNIELAGPLKESGVTIFTVGIGDVTVDSLESICSQPPAEFNHLMPNYQELPIVVDELLHKITSSAVRYSPSYAPVTGGVPVNVHVPFNCLVDVDDVLCAWGATEVRPLLSVAESRAGNSNVFCASPVTNQHGSKPFAVVLRKGAEELRLAALQPFDFLDATPVKPGYFDLTIDEAQNRVTAEWGKFNADPITRVDLVLQRIEYQHLRAEPDVVQEYVIARDVYVGNGLRQSWSGVAADRIPSGFQGLEFLQIRQAASTVGKVSTPWPNDGVPYWTGFRERGVVKGAMSNSQHVPEFVPSPRTPDHSRCSSWYDAELVDMEWHKELEETACPPTAFVAILDSSFDTDQSCCDRNIDPQCWLPHDLPWFYGCERFHPGATHCVRSLPTEGGRRQQCCYGQANNPSYGLVLGYPGGGNAEKSSSLTGHYFDDVRADEWCCTGQSAADCAYYYELRPSRDSEGYDKVFPGGGTGDPHFITLDGFEYTFNGHGEFILIQSTLAGDVGFKVQVRTEPLAGQVDATSTTAVAGAFVCNTDTTNQMTMSAYLLTDGNRRSGEPAIRVLVNNDIIVPDGRPKNKYTWECNGQTYDIAVARGLTSALIQGPGMSLSINAQFDMLSYIVAVGDSYKGKVEGLLGDWNGNPDDDLKPMGSTDFLLPMSNLSTIHYNFGLTWNIRKEDSLFVYRAGESFESINDMSYAPLMDLPDLSGNPDFANSVKALCGENFACIFDASITGNLDIGNASLGFQDQVEEVRSGYLELKDLTEPSAWGFIKSPKHPTPYPERVNWTLVLHKEENSVLAGYENRAGFLRFITEEHDHVTIFALDGSLEANFTGQLQTESRPSEAALPIYRGIGPNTTITFNSDSTLQAPGFLLAYASEIPADEADLPFSSTQTSSRRSIENRGKVGNNKFSLDAGSTYKKNSKRVHVDLRNPASSAKQSVPGLVEMEPSGTHGFFMSPNHPRNYDGNDLVTYEIIAAQNERVVIHFLRFATEEDWDGVILKDVVTGSEIGYTGQVPPDSMYVSSSNTVEATFISDSSNSMTGFLAAFASVSIQ